MMTPPSGLRSGSGSIVEQRRTTKISTLLEETPGMEAVMSSAKQYVGFLNTMLEEDDPEIVDYLIAPLSKDLLNGEDDMAIPRSVVVEEEEEEEEEEER